MIDASVTVEAGITCLPVADDLSIHVPCARYLGHSHGFTLAFYRHPDDPEGFYWNLVKATLTTGEGANPISVVPDLSIPMDCVSCNGRQYGFTLKFYANPYDPSGFYWVLDKSTFVVK